MKVKVKMDALTIGRITKAQVTSAKKTAGHLRTLIINDQVIPLRTGNLQNVLTDVDEKDAKNGKITITHDGPYAARLYYNPQYHFHKEFNRNAKGLWWDEYLVGSKKRIPSQLFKAYFKRESGV